jgi:hypothetical protein
MRKAFIPLFLFWAFLGASAAQAEALRLPVSGVPAFVVNVPPGWTSQYDKWGNLGFIANDHSASLQLSMVADPSVASTSLDDIAANVIKAANASPSSRSEPGTILAYAGRTYYSGMTIRNTHLNLKFVIAKIDDTHAAVISFITRDNMTDAQQAQLDALLGDVQLTLSQ